MGTRITLLWIVPLLLMAVTACEPQLSAGPDLEPVPQSDEVTFEYEHNADNPNVVEFTNTSKGFKALWDLGNGQTLEGQTVTGEYPLKGEYTVSLTIFTESGQAMNSQTITVEETNALMLDDPDLNLLTGGTDQVEGKTWVIDRTQQGHMGVGPVEGATPEWWAAGSDEKTGKGLYDDEYTFKLNGFTYEQHTSGDIYVNTGYPDEFSGAVQEDGGNDYIAPFEGGSDFNFVFKEEEGKKILEITGGGHIGYYSGSRTYEILTLTENELYIRSLNHDGSAYWYQRLIPKGYSHPPVELPYKSEALEDTFDTEGNVAWQTDQVAGFNQEYDNPAPLGVNTSAKVAQYKKGESQWDNIYIDLGYKLNLNERSTIRLKAYMPGYNDYETVDPGAPDWAPNKSLAKQVAVKLQNSQIAEPYTTQAQVIQQVATTDSWVELEFDFSGVTDRDDFDRIVIQIGGEGHYIPGIFFIDDFQLVE